MHDRCYEIEVGFRNLGKIGQANVCLACLTFETRRLLGKRILAFQNTTWPDFLIKNSPA